MGSELQHRRGGRTRRRDKLRASGAGGDTMRVLPSAVPHLARRVARAARTTVLAAALALAVSAAALAGCGSGGGSPGTSADPAGVVPASAQAYAGADVRPEGTEASNALAAGRALTHQADPYTRLLAALQTPGSPALDYKRDVAPWLGRRAGVFVTSLADAGALLPLLEQGLLGIPAGAHSFPFGSGAAQGAFVLDTRDAGKARAFVEAQAAHAGAQRASLDGVAYEHTGGGVAFALVDRFAVIGSEGGVRAVIETAHGSSSLARSAAYSQLVAAAPAGALAHLYTNPVQPGSAARGSAAGPLALLTGSRAANVSLVAAPTSLSVYADSRASASTGTPGGLLASGSEGSRAFDELPGESWLALGLGDVGHSLGADVKALGELAALGSSLTGGGGTSQGSGAITLPGLVEGLLTPLSLMGSSSAGARATFGSWMGSGAVFAGGSGLLDLKGAVVIESRNPSRSHAAVSALAALLAHAGDSSQPTSIPGADTAIAARVNGLPVELDVANGRDSAGTTKFVLGLGPASVTAALAPSSTLASAASRAAAASTLGEGLQPSTLFEVPTLLGLLESVGLTEDPAVSKLTPYLRAVTTIAAGGHPLGNELERFKLVVGLRPAGG
jgi:hypothetical protein